MKSELNSIQEMIDEAKLGGRCYSENWIYGLRDVQKLIEEKIEELKKEKKKLDEEESNVLKVLNNSEIRIEDRPEFSDWKDIQLEKWKVFSKIRVLKELHGGGI